MISKVLWLIYRKVRTSLGLSFGLILMYGVYNRLFNYEILLIASGFMLLHLFGDSYNDYRDYEEDIRNERNDKLTTNNLLTKEQIRRISFLILLSGLALLFFADIYLLLAGVIYSLLLWAYSHPSIRLKKYDVFGYALTESPWLFLPFLLNNFFSLSFSIFTWAFIFFYFFQYMHLLCQKDSTDTKDTTNLFINRGWGPSSFLCAVTASVASISLLTLSLPNTWLVLVWLINLFVKAVNTGMIWERKAERKMRGRLVLIEFLTPYLFVIGTFL